MMTWDETPEERLDREATEFAKRVTERIRREQERKAQTLQNAIEQEMAWQERMVFARHARSKTMELLYDVMGHRTREVPEADDLAHAGTIGRWT